MKPEGTSEINTAFLHVSVNMILSKKLTKQNYAMYLLKGGGVGGNSTKYCFQNVKGL